MKEEKPKENRVEVYHNIFYADLFQDYQFDFEQKVDKLDTFHYTGIIEPYTIARATINDRIAMKEGFKVYNSSKGDIKLQQMELMLNKFDWNDKKFHEEYSFYMDALLNNIMGYPNGSNLYKK